MLIPSAPDKKGNRLFEVTEQPSVEPITVEEVKVWARIDGTDEDDLITELIKSTRIQIEKYLNRSLIQQTVEMILDYWPRQEIELPRGDVISFTKIELLDEDNAITEYDSDKYYLAGGTPNRLVIKSDDSVPDPSDVGNRNRGGIKLTWFSGYGTAASDVPQTIKEALKLWVTFIYENRVMNPNPPLDVKTLLEKFRILNR
ncbi:phage head-tail connector protein [Candidatus Pacearchaeota archaeon]|nr:phage head-tail connector protein [Candidatus Pacearchaeota archaeon]